MATESDEVLEALLRECHQAAPQPWYPSAYAAQTGMDRALLDADLDRLRMGGLVRLTDWVQGKGQGYALTPEGALVLQNTRLLRRLKDGKPLSIESASAAAVPISGPSAWDRGEAVRDAVLNPARPIVTFTLLGLNIAIFLVGLAMAMQQQTAAEYLAGSANDEVVAFKIAKIRGTLGALDRKHVVVLDQWWRLLSHCFLHGGLLHLAFNMYFLFSLGPIVETMWGPVRYLVLYLISGLGGGVAVVLANSGAVGASGALCGLLTSMGVWVYLNRVYLGNLSSVWLRGIGTNLILIGIISFLPGISLASHLGGALTGAVVAVPLVYQRFGRAGERLLGLLGTIAVPVFLIGLVLASITKDEKVQRSILARGRIEQRWAALSRSGSSSCRQPTSLDRRP